MTLSLKASLTELPEYRRVLGNLIARDLKVKYQTKALGFLWSLLYPALMIGICYTVFKRIIKIEMPHYWAFLIVGMLPFQFVQNAIAEGSSTSWVLLQADTAIAASNDPARNGSRLMPSVSVSRDT